LCKNELQGQKYKAAFARHKSKKKSFWKVNKTSLVILGEKHHHSL
jgi:hypothetical protein